MIYELIVLFGAGLAGGVINSLAGGGSFITFPALLLVGIPPVSANATNTFASCAGYLSGAYAFREDLYSYRKKLIVIVLVSLTGGALGAWLLIQTPDSAFEGAIPWLLLFALFLFVFGTQINIFLKKVTPANKHMSAIGATSLLAMLLVVSVYGGFFNAGLGIIALSYLALAGYTNIHVMNGIKLLISSSIAITAIVLFILSDSIAWREGSAVLVGTLLGGYFSARIAKRIAPVYIRNFVIIASLGITVYFFVETYT